jgi:CTP:phosphocholine cytidylyltransferase-like protein/thiamine kinase-like enzyme
MERNAIILAAGKSTRFAPFTYEKPKGLFCVKGEILIERQIRQLFSAGVKDVFVVVGYMKEKFFYLEQKFGVKLIVNNEFARKGNLLSVFAARNFLADTYICCADQYFVSNPYSFENPENFSYRACSFQGGKFKEFAVKVSDADVITDFHVGGSDCLAMVGHAYFNKKFSRIFRGFLENEIGDFGVANMFWEEFFARHMDSLTLYKKEFARNEILEFEDIDSLRDFDSEFLDNVDSEIMKNISSTLKCKPGEVTDIEVINAGLTNVSFSFCAKGEKFVYRHPGGTAGNLVDRRTEIFAQDAAKKIGIDCSVVKIDLRGWKISRFVHDVKNCDFEKNDFQLQKAMEYLRRLHETKIRGNVKIFDCVAEGKKLMAAASATKGNLAEEFSEIVLKIDELYAILKSDAKRLGFGLVLCHNDTYEPNFLCGDDSEIYLIDWEYAGLNYAANDIGSILCRGDFSDAQIQRYLKFFAGRNLSADEERFYTSFVSISAFYWFCWGLYKGSVGDDDSFFFLPSYRNLIRFTDCAIERYKNKNEFFGGEK